MVGAREVLERAYGSLWATSITRVLKGNGYIIVDKGAIGRAQREAVRQYEEDKFPFVNSTRPEWHLHKLAA